MPIQVPQIRILVVDDDKAICEYVTTILERDGMSVVSLTNPLQAEEEVRNGNFHLIILDLMMPKMDGIEVLRRIRKIDNDVAVVIFTGYPNLESAVATMKLDAVDYITKPFQVEEVVARVETHLALRRLQRNLQEANQRMERELALAAQVQASFMQRTLPDIPGWQLAVTLVPARTTSGDFYDVVPLPAGKLSLLIADVVDKGVGAALYMAMSSALLRAYTGEHPADPDLVCEAVNARLLDYATTDQFVTVFLGMLDPDTGMLAYSNAGHNPPIWLRPVEAGQVQLLRNTGLPLGVIDGGAWPAQTIRMAPGDVVVLYTDGVTDAQSVDGDFYDLSRLVEIISGNAGATASEIRDAILDDVLRFTHDAAQSDDMAVMVLVRQ